jgi:CRP/FNR family transcriptional regulator, anaerobic regulatory protein
MIDDNQNGADAPVSGLDRGLSETERERLAAISRIRCYRRGATVHAAGEPRAFVAEMRTGVAKRLKSLSDGRQQIVRLLFPGEILGRAHVPSHDLSVEAATDLTLRVFDRPRFESLMLEIPALENAMRRAIAAEIDAAQQWMALISGRSVRARLAGFLAYLLRCAPHRLDAGPERPRELGVKVPVGRSDMARYLATTEESISRTVQELVRAGVLASDGANRFRVLDLATLNELAETGEAAEVRRGPVA